MSNSTNNILREYIRNKKNNPIGVAVAVRQGDQVFYGYSLCNPKDRYNKQFGVDIAVNRALSERGFVLPLASSTRKSVLSQFLALERRSLKYFKDVPEGNILLELEESVSGDSQ